MKIYIEFLNGEEIRIPKFLVKSISEIYIRIWIGYRVLILSSKEGVKTKLKSKSKIKFILGFA